MSQTKIKVHEDHLEACVLFVSLIANPATGKSSGLNLIRDALLDIEKFDHIEPKDSSLVQGATIEGIVEILKTNQCIISLFDEASAFWGSFGRYTTGNGSYDRAFYTEIYNALSVYRRDLKSERTFVNNPRLNIYLMGHPHAFIKCMLDEKSNKVDGLMQRFLSCCPQPMFYKSNFINDAREVSRSISLKVLLYCVKLLHSIVIENDLNIIQKEAIIYTFDAETTEFFNSFCDRCKEVCEVMNLRDIFIRYI
jgi:hypothetical protein